jgi:hypothetical protein
MVSLNSKGGKYPIPISLDVRKGFPVFLDDLICLPNKDNVLHKVFPHHILNLYQDESDRSLAYSIKSNFNKSYLLMFYFVTQFIIFLIKHIVTSPTIFIA